MGEVELRSILALGQVTALDNLADVDAQPWMMEGRGSVVQISSYRRLADAFNCLECHPWTTTYFNIGLRTVGGQTTACEAK